MQISAVGSYTPRFAASRANTVADRSNFDALMQGADKSTMSASSAATSKSTATSATKPNYENMSPAEFGSRGSEMYKRGEIDFDTMTAMVMRADSIARQDAEAGQSGEYNFKDVFKGYMQFIEKSGKKNDPTSGYNILEKVMNKIA